jgi:P27 family predicted phage terminase small subunit
VAKRGPKERTGLNTRRSPTEATTVEIPGDLDAEEAAEFGRLAEQLRGRGLLERTDVRAIEMAACCYAEIVRARAVVKAEGLTLTASNGTAMPHPMIAVINTLRMRLRGLLKDMGLVPSSSKLATLEPSAEPDRSDPWNRVLHVVSG